MKQLKRKLGCTVSLCFVGIVCSAQLIIPFNIRNIQIAKCYQLSSQQISDYNKVLNEITAKWNLIKDTKLSVSNRKHEEKKLQNDFSTSIKGIFSNQQYDKWKKNHDGNLTKRIYKEDLGMTDEQYIEFEKISMIYSSKEEEIAQENLIETERSEHRKTAINWFSSSLHNVFSEILADYLVYENQVLNTALTLSKRYTIIPESKAIKCAILKIKFNSDRDIIEKQNLTKNQIRKKRNILRNNYENAIHEILTQEEYIACVKNRERINNIKLRATYNMSQEQFIKYKELKKNFAIRQLAIKQSKIDKISKLGKLRAIENDFNQKLQEILGAKQYERWKRNEQIKHIKNQKY